MPNNPMTDAALAELDRLHETAIPLTFANAAGHIFNAYPSLRQRLTDAEARLAEARKDNDELDGTDAAHPAWWRGNDAGVAQVCAKINAILDGADVFGTASEPWESTRRRVAEAQRDSERLAWAWANPDKFVAAQRSTPPRRTGRQQIDAARGAK